MFQLFFVEKHILSELVMYLFPGLLEKKPTICEKDKYHVGY